MSSEFNNGWNDFNNSEISLEDDSKEYFQGWESARQEYQKTSGWN